MMRLEKIYLNRWFKMPAPAVQPSEIVYWHKLQKRHNACFICHACSTTRHAAPVIAGMVENSSGGKVVMA